MKVVIVDDDKLVCHALKTILEADGDIFVSAIGNSADEAVSLYKEHMPDVLLSDIRMKEATGIDSARNIISEFPDAKILLLTTFTDDEYIVDALKIGVKGYILKQNFDSIVPSIKAVYNGQNVYGEEIVAKTITTPKKNEAALEGYDLTEREIEVIKLVAEGLNNKEIAGKLFLGEGTVRNYLSVILEKLDLRDRTQLAIFYYKRI